VAANDVLAILAAGRKIDVILTEVQLPGSIDGFELARQIRENHPDIDVILASGVPRVAGKADDLCEDGPLEKPYHPQEVVRRTYLLRERGEDLCDPSCYLWTMSFLRSSPRTH
jgi:CheY-like chemotaxis protein